MSLADIKFENCRFEELNLPLSIEAPEGEPLSFTLDKCSVSFSDSYGDAPFISTVGHGKILLTGVKIMNGKPYIKAVDTCGIEITNSSEIEIRTQK